MNTSPSELVTINLNIGPRAYHVSVPKELALFLNNIIKQPEPVIKFQVRNKLLSSYIASIFSIWTTLCIEKIEPDLLDWIDAMPEDAVMYDIGASTGPFSLYAAARGIKVIAFEPEAQNFSLLEMNNFLNKQVIHPITCLNMALSDSIGLGTMYCANYKKGAHNKILDRPKEVLETKHFVPEHVQSVIKYPLDSAISAFKLPFPDYIKIDVDGAEEAVIAGAKHTLQNPDLRGIFIELTDSEEGTRLIEVIKSYGLQLVSKQQVEDYAGLINYIFFRG